MRRTVATLGTLLVAAVIIISGSAVATWVFADHYEVATTSNCKDPWEAEDAPDDVYASVGKHIPPAPPVLGCIMLDMGSANVMPNSQDFTVFAGSESNETYDVSVGDDPDPEATEYVGSGWDTEDLTFQTPSGPPGTLWRYIFIEGTSGDWATDPAYGPEIDAVGWDKP